MTAAQSLTEAGKPERVPFLIPHLYQSPHPTKYVSGALCHKTASWPIFVIRALFSMRLSVPHHEAQWASSTKNSSDNTNTTRNAPYYRALHHGQALWLGNLQSEDDGGEAGQAMAGAVGSMLGAMLHSTVQSIGEHNTAQMTHMLNILREQA